MAAALCCAAVTAQPRTGNGGISPEMMSEIRTGYTGTAEQKAVRNALAGTSITALSVNGENLANPDGHFSHKVPTKGITDQKSSGRCWLFSGLNVLRSEMIRRYDLPLMEFSQNYLFFYDQLEKSNLFLQSVIDTRELPLDSREVDWLLQDPIGDGGQFTGVSNLVTKYGLVPSSAMPETYQSENTSQMRSVLSQKLREFALRLRDADVKDVMAEKTAMLKEIYGILAKCLGVPPETFRWARYDSRGKLVSEKEYTPLGFFHEYFSANLETDYVMVMNDPSREMGKVYEIAYDRHVYDGHNWLYLNLPLDKIKEMAVASIKDSTAMYFSCDVGKFIDRKKGTLDLRNSDQASLFSTTFPMDKRQRIQTHASGSSHAMTLTAVDIDPKTGETRKWMVENSWGNTGYQGNLIMTDKWFDEYMFRLVINRKYVPADVLELLKQKPVLLPAWDPMFLPED